jgi:asparagine N-glycosylation enzyme membrane subunit Stt3
MTQQKTPGSAIPASLLDRAPVAVPGLLVAAILLVRCLFAYSPEVLHGGLVDTDSYMHIVRLEDLVRNGAWHYGFFPRDNAPFGMALHWTKAYDIMALAIAAPIALFAGWHTAFATVAVLVGPLSIAALILAGCWAAAPICPAPERRLIGILIAISPSIFANGQIGDCDHHVTVTAAWVLFMGLALRVVLMRGEAALRVGIAAGLAAAFALWVSVECILAVCLGVALIGLGWVRDGAPVRRGSLAFALSFAPAMVALLAFDPPYGGWANFELDRLAFVHVAFALLVALLFLLLAYAPQAPERWRARLALAVAGSAVAAAAIIMLFPGLIQPEQALFREDDIPGFWEWNDINEMKPAFQFIDGGILFMGAPFIGLASALSLAWEERRTKAGPAWVLMVLMLALIGTLGLIHIRFAMYPEVLAAYPAAVALSRLGGLMARLGGGVWLRQGAQAVAAAIIVAGPILGFAVASAIIDRKTPPEPDCAVRKVAPALNDAAFMGGRDLIILSEPNEAPEILYWTDHGTIFGPYHTNREGLHDLARFFTSTDDVAAKAVVARRGIAYVMLCHGDTGTSGGTPAGERPIVAMSNSAPPMAEQGPPVDPHVLYLRLLRGEVPPWLKPQPWPKGVKTDLRLFRVAPGKG